MCKEVTKIMCGMLVAASLGMATSCGGNGGAEALYSAAKSMYENGDYVTSLELIDSLKSAYPEAIDIQRGAMHLRTLDDEQLILQQIAQNDSALDASVSELATMVADFTFIKDANMVEGYSVNNKAKANPLVNRTGIEARIDERANVYVVSLLNGKRANHDHIEVTRGSEFARSETVPYNDATNYRFKVDGVSNEMVTFRGGMTDTLCMFINANRGAALRVSYIGSSTVSETLKPADVEVIAETYRYAKALQANRNCEAQKKYLSAKLQITREQQAKTKEYYK